MPPTIVPLPPLSPNLLLSLAAFAIIGLIVLIARFKCNAVVALMLATLVVGIPSMPLENVAKSFQTGVGATLGGLAMIIGLGTILGKLLAESGAAEVIANTMVRLFGEKRIDYAVMVVAFLVGISVFFGVGIVILGPIGFMLARRTGMPILRLMLPLAAGLSTAHGLIPPHPGPMAAISLIGADTGKTILWSLIIGAPTALITGPFLARWVAPKVPVALGGLGSEATSKPEAPRAPGFALSVFTMLLPVLLMLLGTAAQIFLPPGNGARGIASFLAEPVVAMLIAVLISFFTFGVHCGLNGSQILRFSEQCVAPAASILLLIGAGGGFSRVLTDSGVGKAIADTSSTWPVSPLLLGWMIAGALRIAVGSATVAVTMAAGIMVSVLKTCPETNRELLVLAMGAGSLILSHVNDSGFWFVKEYLGMTVSQTLRTWTVVETGIAVISIIFILAANAVI